jgi:hypothetical protein
MATRKFYQRFDPSDPEDTQGFSFAQLRPTDTSRPIQWRESGATFHRTQPPTYLAVLIFETASYPAIPPPQWRVRDYDRWISVPTGLVPSI